MKFRDYKKREAEFKRPNHPDFMTTSELKKIKWSGLRNNSISGDTEIWIEGEIVKLITAFEKSSNKNAVEEAMQKQFP